MKKTIKINNQIKSFNKIISIEGDKSLSIRWALLASQSNGKSKSFNLLKSEDVLNTLKCLKKLGIKIKMLKNFLDIQTQNLSERKEFQFFHKVKLFFKTS